MKVLVTGANGQLGRDVCAELKKRKIEFLPADIDTLDITDEAAVKGCFVSFQPSAVIHCAAWTAVDAAEEAQNRSWVFTINEKATGYIAEHCKESGAKLLYLSTDYVFSGEGDEPWSEDCADFRPLNVYGESKLAGELAVKRATDKNFIVRISWVCGANGNNFVKTMLSLAKKNSELRVVDDQIGVPTFTFDLAKLLVDLILSEKFGTYHATNSGGFISWADFAEAIFNISDDDVKVKRVSTEEYGLNKAKRPKNSRMSIQKLQESGFEPLPNWRKSLKKLINILKTDATN